MLIAQVSPSFDFQKINRLNLPKSDIWERLLLLTERKQQSFLIEKNPLRKQTQNLLISIKTLVWS